MSNLSPLIPAKKRNTNEKNVNERKKKKIYVYVWIHIYIYFDWFLSFFVSRSYGSPCTPEIVDFVSSSYLARIARIVRVLWFLNAVQEHLYLLNRLDRSFGIFFVFFFFLFVSPFSYSIVISITYIYYIYNNTLISCSVRVLCYIYIIVRLNN